MKPTIIYAAIWYLITESENAIWFACGALSMLTIQLLISI